jgi:hypothetical protein
LNLVFGGTIRDRRVSKQPSRAMAPSYDPNRSPDPEWWLALDEGERIRMAEAFHRKARIRLPNARVHAVLHAIVENQIALGSELPVAATLARLIREGLSRHEALHAIASVLAVYMGALQRGELASREDPHTDYFAALAELTPETWRQQFG